MDKKIFSGLIPRLSLVFLVATQASAQLGPDLRITAVDTLITYESGTLAGAVDLHVGPDGEVYVVDRLNSQVHRLAASGEQLSSVGTAGSGPGEFLRPIAVRADANSFTVIDQGNGRTQRFDRQGEYLSSRVLPPLAAYYRSDVGPSGRIAVSTLGQGSELAAVYDFDGQLEFSLGTAPAQMPSELNGPDIRARIRRGEIPEFFRNTAFPHFGPQGDVWLNLITDGLIQRYDVNGVLRFQVELDEPEMEGILEAFVERHSDLDARGFSALQYAADLYAIDDELWVLLNREDDEASVIIRLSPDGERRGRVVVPQVEGADQLAVDPERLRLYLAVSSTAEIVRVQMTSGTR